MEDQIFTLVKGITWAGVAALALWIVVAPWTRFIIERLSPKTGNGKIITEDSLDLNHLHEIRNDIKDLKIDMSEVRREQIKQGKDISWLQAKQNGRGK